MKKYFPTQALALLIISSVLLSTVLAHQPRLVEDQTEVIVTLPEISKAYYGNLAGKPVTYRIKTTKPFRLYVNILVPDIEGIEMDVSAKILKEGTIISLLEAGSHNWKKFHEPFAGDDYYRGPEYAEMQDPGTYEVQLYSPDNQGKYVLAVGDREAFPLNELIKTYIVLPRLKSQFFGKSALSAYSNLMGLFLGIMLLIVLVIAVFLFFTVKFIRKKMRVSRMKRDISS